MNVHFVSIGLYIIAAIVVLLLDYYDLRDQWRNRSIAWWQIIVVAILGLTPVLNCMMAASAILGLLLGLVQQASRTPRQGTATPIRKKR